MASNLSSEEYYYILDNIAMSASQVLKKVFKKRWRKETGSDWKNSEAQGNTFKEGLGKTAYSEAKKQQKIKIANGNLDEWDMTLAAMVLRYFGDAEVLKAENIAVKTITGLRNELAHHPTKKFNHTEYTHKLLLIQEALKVLIEDATKIENLIEQAVTRSSEAMLKAIKDLLQKGETYLKNKKLKKAIAVFDEASTMSSSSTNLLGLVYEKRAESYLLLANHKKIHQNQNESNTSCENALLDAIEAAKLNPNSWNAHNLLGKCYRFKDELNTAIHNFVKALAISPSQNEVRKELHSCKLRAGVRRRLDSLDPRNSPMNLKEHIARVEESTQQRITHELLLYMKIRLAEFIPGEDYVHQAHQYQMGWDVQPNDKVAACFFAMAAEKGNPEGIHNLGRCYEKGLGVPEDIGIAYELFRKAARMSPQIPGTFTTLKKNIGVATSQLSLGLCYEYGIGVTQNYKKAAMWYKKSAENGMGNAANNLALFYEKGVGVPANSKMSEMYWNQAVILGSYNAAENLMEYCIAHLELERAETLFKTGKLLGNTDLLALSEEKFKMKIKKSLHRRNELEIEVTEFEKENCLDVKGLTFLERYERQQLNKETGAGMIHKLQKSFFEFLFTDEVFGRTFDLEAAHNNSILLQTATQESTFAARVCKTLILSRKLSQFLFKRSSLKSHEINYVLDTLYEICCLEFHLSLFPSNIQNKLLKITEELLIKKCNGETNSEDMKIRLCYIFFHFSLTKSVALQSLDTLGIEVLKQAIRMYSENPHYYRPLATLYGQLKDYKLAVYWADEGLQKFPNNFELFYIKGIFLLISSQIGIECEDDNIGAEKLELQKAIFAFQSYIHYSPSDHKYVPLAFYILASLHLPGFLRNPTFRDLYEANNYFVCFLKSGQDAEMCMLPCYFPYSQTKFANVLRALATFYNATNLNTLDYLPLIKRKSIFERKPYLADPVRRMLILEHRWNLFNSEIVMSIDGVIPTTVKPKLQQNRPKVLSRLVPITLREMNPSIDNIYEDRMIDLTIVDKPTIGLYYSIHLVAEDENGDVTRLYIYNVKQDQEAAKIVGYGCTVAVLNPYMRIGSQDRSNGLRVDDPNCVISLGKVNNMCGLCGVANSQYKCGSCRQAYYCSRECQQLDWKIMKHKLICDV